MKDQEVVATPEEESPQKTSIDVIHYIDPSTDFSKYSFASDPSMKSYRKKPDVLETIASGSTPRTAQSTNSIHEE